jgi:NAD(P)-dependent dehydrogenase (short-subunit alcohol dehydrogenase family)
MLLQDRMAIVTGGGRGIGRAIALRFAAEGARVFVTARTGAEVEAVVREIQAAGGQAAFVAADVGRAADCRKIIDAARQAFGAVHILVNNAGIYGPVLPAEEITPEEWDEVMAVNLRGPFLLARLVLPEMYKQGSGSMINVVSIAAKAALAMNGPYAASKTGLIGLTRTLAAEGGRKGVRVNAISPGPVPETKMSQELGNALAKHFQMDPAALLENLNKNILQGRPQTADEIAAAALFLASDQSSAITGQALNVDGGMAFF